MMALEVKKDKKTDPIKMSLFRTPSGLAGSIFFYGKIGAGKSLAILSLCQKYHDHRGFKIWDLWGGERNQGENMYWCLPSSHLAYWRLVKKKLRLDRDGPKQYKVNLAFPITKSMPEKLPLLKNKDDEVVVNPKPFTIPIKSIKIETISLVLGTLNDSNITLWQKIKEKLKPSDGTPELIRFFDKYGKNNVLWKNFFEPLIDMGLISSSDDENVLDIKSEAKDRDGIFIPVLHYVPDKFKLFIMGWVLWSMWDLMNDGKISGKNIIPMREASKFFRATEKSIVEDRYKVFKVQLSDFIRYARGKMHFFLDCQSPSETKGLVDGSQDFTILGKLPSEEDRKFATDQLRRDGKITQKQITDIGELEGGEYYIVESGKDAKKRYFLLPSTDYWKEGHGNFYDIWKRRHGVHAVKDFKELKRHIKDKFDLRMKEIRDFEKEEKLRTKQLRDRKEEIEEEKKLEKAREREKKMYESKREARQEVRDQEKLDKEKKEKNKKGEVVKKQEGDLGSPTIKDDEDDLDIMEMMEDE